MTKDLAAQLIAVVICLISVVCYFNKKKSGFLLIQAGVNVLYCVQYLLLGALSGIIGNSITSVKFFSFYLDAKNERKTTFKKSLIFCILGVGLGIFGLRDGWFAIIPMINAVLITYATAQDDPVIMRICYTVANASWIIFNFMTRAYVSAVYSAVELVVSLVSVFVFLKARKREE